MSKQTPKVVASIEARMGSSRLPGKVLKDIHGHPALTRLLQRLRRCQRLDDIVLATTVHESDDVLEDWAKSNGLLCYRGSEEDVLQRVVDAQRYAASDVVVEITGDCILTDPQIVDMGVHTFWENDCDVVSNCRKRAYPMGMCVQVFRLKDLAYVAEHIDDAPVREHVSLYFYEHPELYRLIHLMPPARWYAPEWRFQIDYPADLEFTRQVYGHLEPRYGESFGLEEIMDLCREYPHLPEINRCLKEKSAR
ncbi:MAG: glycosyltransferase family protein [Candidatus Melainabacteria bacterium]|nr:glycosyltransferase family protein [Candidatus Melainabacteria bacterium]